MNRTRGLAVVCAGIALLLNFMIERLLLAVQANSVLIPGFLDFRPAWNRGISFSLFWQSGASGRYLLSAVLLALVVLVAILAWRATSMLAAAGFGFVIGGALGNLIDRNIFGAVFDYLFLHLGAMPLFVCNFSDIAISVGFILLLGDGFSGSKRHAAH